MCSISLILTIWEEMFHITFSYKLFTWLNQHKRLWPFMKISVSKTSKKPLLWRKKEATKIYIVYYYLLFQEFFSILNNVYIVFIISKYDLKIKKIDCSKCHQISELSKNFITTSRMTFLMTTMYFILYKCEPSSPSHKVINFTLIK